MRKVLSRMGMPPLEPAKLTPGINVVRPEKAYEGERLTTCCRHWPNADAISRASYAEMLL